MSMTILKKIIYTNLSLGSPKEAQPKMALYLVDPEKAIRPSFGNRSNPEFFQKKSIFKPL